MDQGNDVLVKRLERLERSNRRLKLLSFVVLAAIGTMGAARGIPHTFDELDAKLVKTEGLIVVDANGKLRVAIGADPATEGGGMLVYQRDGVARVGIGIDGATNNAATSFADPSGTNRAAMVAFPDGSAASLTFEPTGTLGTLAFTSPGANGLNGYFVYQPDGAQRASIFSRSDASFMQLLSPSGDTAVGMFEPSDGSVPEFNILDLNKTIRTTIAASDPSTGNPFEVMRIFGANGKIRVSADSGIGSNNGLVHTYDSSGVQNDLLGVP